jgi:hypothetical protein
MNKVDFLLLISAYIALVNCLIRSDFNLVTSLVCYFYWNSRQTKPRRISNLILMILGIVLVFDLIWLVSIWSQWTSSEFISTIWSQLRGWRILIIILSIINMVVKVAIGFFIQMETKNELPYHKMKNE